MNSWAGWVVGLGVALGAAAAVSPAKAVVINGLYGAELEYVTGGVIVRDGTGETFQGRQWDKLSDRRTQARDAMRSQVGGNGLEYEIKRKAVPLKVLEAGGLTLARYLPVLNAGMLLYDLFEAVRVYPDEESHPGLLFDPGQAPTPGGMATQYRYGNDAWGSPWSLTKPEACAAYPLGRNGSTVLTRTAMRNQNQCDLWYCHASAYDSGDCSEGSGEGRLTMDPEAAVRELPEQCPASIDPLNPEYSIPAGASPDIDGQCPTARYNWRRISPEDAAQRVEQYAPPDGDKLRDVAQDTVARGGEITAEEPLEVSGPPSIAGQPATRTWTDGNGDLRTETKTPTVNYTYNDNRISYTTVIVTTTTTNGQPDGNPEVEERPPEDVCKDNPGVLGCAKFGDVPTDKPAWETREVPYDPEALGLPAACPAPVTWQVGALTLGWSYAPVCEVAPIVRLALLVFAGIGAISVIIRETTS